MLSLKAEKVLDELERLGEVAPDHFKKPETFYIAPLIRQGLAEWIRAREPYSHLATALRITERGREEVKEIRFRLTQQETIK